MRPDTDVYNAPPPRGSPRAASDAAARAEEVLGREGRVALAGPWGAGKTTVLEDVLRAPSTGSGGRTVLRVTTVEGDGEHAFGALAQMLSRCGPAGLGSLSRAQNQVVDRLLHRGAGEPLAASEQLPARLAVTALLGSGRWILAVDGAQWLDPASADVLGYALRTLPAPALTAIVTERVHGRAHAAARLLGGHPAQVDVAPLDAEETAALLGAHGLPTRWAGPLQSQCGGHRLLTTVSCAALAGLPASERHRPALCEQALDAAGAWLRDTLPEPARHTLMLAALTSRPSLSLLLRAGRSDAEEHLARAQAAGVLHMDPGGGVRFTASALARAAARSQSRPRRASAHLTLARAVGDPVHEVRHRALAADLPDQGLAEDTEAAAATARDAGERA
ncbi:ATP-binding protein, partial [Streptomyces sp. NPDC054956]